MKEENLLKEPITIPPHETREVPLTLTDETIRRLNSGEGLIIEMTMAVPAWLSSIWVRGTVLFLSGWGLADVFEHIINYIAK